TLVLFFSSRRRHARFSRDWSSDVCSSDLGQADPLLHATAELVGAVVFPSLQAYGPQGGQSPFPALTGRYALHFEAVLHVAQYGAVGEKGEALEYHAELLTAHFPQFPLVQGGDVLAVHDDLTGGRVVNAVNAAQQGGLAAAGEAHHDEDFAGVDGEVNVVNADGGARAALDFFFRRTRGQQPQRFRGRSA